MFLGWLFEIVSIILIFSREIAVFYEKRSMLGCVNFFVKRLTESCGFIKRERGERERDLWFNEL